jgi:hypothetical protein
MVHDKETKLRETLKLMGLTRFSNSMAYLIVQGSISFLSSGIFSIILMI